MQTQQPYERCIATTLAKHAEHGVPSTVDVRAVFEEHLAARERDPLHGAQRAPRQGARRVFAVGLMVTILLTLGLIAAVAPVRAALNARLQQRFGLVLIDPQAPPPTAAPQSPVTAPPVASGALTVGQRVAKISVAEAQRQAAFPLRLPAWLPDGLQAADAFVSPSGGVSIFLRRPGSAAFVQLEQVQVPAGGGYGVAASRVEQVRVADRPAAYAKGGWRAPGVWDETIDLQYLSWEADGVSYVLHDNGVGLSREELIRIAESLRWAGMSPVREPFPPSVHTV